MCGFLLFFVISCQSSSDTNKLHLKISLSNDTIYFNSLKFNDTLKSFVYCYNKSQQNIKILRLENACGCTSGILNDSIIKSNDSVLVNIKYVPKFSNDSGKVLKFLSIRTNSNTVPFLNIILKGDVIK